MISGNYNNLNGQVNNLQYGAIKDVVPENVNHKLPESIQNIDAKEIANNNGAVAAAGKIDKRSALLTLPVYASFIALRNLNDSKGPFGFAGEYEKSFLGKLSKAGDVITKGIKKLIPDSFENFVKTKSTSAKNWLLEHSAMARSLTTPIKYENKMAIDSANGLFGRVMGDNAIMFEKGYKGGLSELKELFGENTKIWELFKKNGIENFASNKEGARNIVSKVLREIGEQPVSDPKVQEYTREIIKGFSKSNQGIEISKWGRLPVGKIPVLGKFLTLKVPASEMSNKLRVAANVSGSDLATGSTFVGTTVLGRALPSVFAKLYEGLTSDFVGGKIAPAIQAYFIASAALKAKEAPKGQKLATFMDEETNAASYLITMPIATALLAKAGGLKYVGMGDTKEAQKLAVDKFRDMIATLNGKIDAGTITRGEYLKEVKNIKNQLKGNTKFWQKPFKAIGKIIGSNFDKETIKPFIDDAIPEGTSSLKAMGLNLSNRVQNFLYKFKTGKYMGITPGGLLRFGLVMFVLSPLVSKPINKLVNKIFGKPYKPNEDKQVENKKTKKEQKKNSKNAENPFVNLTDEQMISLLQKNKANIIKAQNNPELMNELQSNPKKLYDFLVQGAQEYDKALQNQAPSSLLRDYANKVRNGQSQNKMTANPPLAQNYPNQMHNGQGAAPIQNTTTLNINNFNPNAKMPPPSIKPQEENKQNTQVPKNMPEYKRSYSYVPSSSVSSNILNAQAQQNEQLNAILKDMDDTEKKFREFTSI